MSGRIGVLTETDGGFGSIYGLTRPSAIFIQTRLDDGCYCDKSFPKDEQII